MDVPPPTKILSFSSPGNDAAITFINSTTVNGLLLQHGQAFDVVASEDSLQVLIDCKTLYISSIFCAKILYAVNNVWTC